MAQTVRADDSGRENRNHYWFSKKYLGFGDKVTSVFATSYKKDDGSLAPANVVIASKGKTRTGEEWKGNVTIDARDIPEVIKDLQTALEQNEKYFKGQVGQSSVRVPDSLRSKN
jgi:hypothetical protein